MDIFDVVRADKTNVRIGAWGTGKVPNASFPLNRSGRLPAGQEWSWRVVQFDALGKQFRVLIRCNEEKEYHTAILALETPTGLAVVCHHELHKTHRNWHCHLVRCDISYIFPGVLRDKNRMIVWPHSDDLTCMVSGEVRRENALTIAAKRYRFAAHGELI